MSMGCRHSSAQVRLCHTGLAAKGRGGKAAASGEGGWRPATLAWPRRRRSGNTRSHEGSSERTTCLVTPEAVVDHLPFASFGCEVVRCVNHRARTDSIEGFATLTISAAPGRDREDAVPVRPYSGA